MPTARHRCQATRAASRSAISPVIRAPGALAPTVWFATMDDLIAFLLDTEVALLQFERAQRIAASLDRVIGTITTRAGSTAAISPPPSRAGARSSGRNVRRPVRGGATQKSLRLTFRKDVRLGEHAGPIADDGSTTSWSGCAGFEVDAPSGRQRAQRLERLVDVLRDPELALDHAAHDALAVDDEGHALRRNQPPGARRRRALQIVASRSDTSGKFRLKSAMNFRCASCESMLTPTIAAPACSISPAWSRKLHASLVQPVLSRG